MFILHNYVQPLEEGGIIAWSGFRIIFETLPITVIHNKSSSFEEKWESLVRHYQECVKHTSAIHKK